MSNVIIIDASTGEVIERPATEEELANQVSIGEESATIEAELQAKADARTSALAKLAALGLTEEEIAAL
jgi:hypothetical protein